MCFFTDLVFISHICTPLFRYAFPKQRAGIKMHVTLFKETERYSRLILYGKTTQPMVLRRVQKSQVKLIHHKKKKSGSLIMEK